MATPPATPIVDPTELPNGVPFTYTNAADYGSKGTSLSFASITAVNDAPVANPDSYNGNEDTRR